MLSAVKTHANRLITSNCFHCEELNGAIVLLKKDNPRCSGSDFLHVTKRIAVRRIQYQWMGWEEHGAGDACTGKVLIMLK